MISDQPPLRHTRSDGNFSILQPRSALAFTGERMTSAAEGQIEFEHYHRYCLTRDLCDRLDVVDVASGEGYGAAMLAGIARSVVGVEIDAESVAHATTNYQIENLRFVQGDALALPLPDKSADMVVSFETLEHLADHQQFIAEVRRILRQDGLFVVSTPDRATYSAAGTDPNPFHILELTKLEFQTLLAASFTNHHVLAQRPMLGSIVAAEGSATWRSYERRDVRTMEATNGLARAHYLIGIATDGDLPEVASSVYLDRRRVHDVVESMRRLPSLEEHAQVMVRERDEARADMQRIALDQAGALRERDEARADAQRIALDQAGALRERDEARADMQRIALDRASAFGERDKARADAQRMTRDQANALSWEQTRAADEATRLNAAVADISAQVEVERNRASAAEQDAERVRAAAGADIDRSRREMNAVLYSTSWRLLTPVRVAGARFPALARMLRRAVKLLFWTVTLQLGTRYAARRRYHNELLHAVVAQPDIPQIDKQAVLLDSEQPYAALAHNFAPTPDIPALRKDLREAFLTWHGTEPIYFPPIAAPDVTVIIPVYKGLADLQTCLRSLAVHREPNLSFDVIVIDDCPTEPVLWAVPESGGLIKLSNNENLGFLLTCNRAAASARGHVLCFLNSDTIVSRNWLQSLVNALNEVPGAALAGSMMLNVDGTIQDAGWRILGNGWGHPLGRGSEARDGAHTYRRRVDCVTGACLAIKRTQFEKMGGFDPLYAPAFYEEFDLALRLRARGLHTVYEPRSQIVHLGSASYGAARRDALSMINQNKFVERFEQALRKQPYDTGDNFMLRHGSETGPVILVVDYGIPQPDRHAGDVTMNLYLSLLVEAGWCVVFAPMNGVADGPAADALERLGIELVRAPHDVEGWLSKNGSHVGRVWLSRPSIAEALIGPVRAHTRATIAYYPHDLHHVRLLREAALHGDQTSAIEIERVRTQECAVFRAVDSVIAPSEEESATIRHLVPGTSVTVLPPYFYDGAEIVTYDQDHFVALDDIVFVGGFPHTPNVDAALFIANEVMPLVWQTCPDARLVLVGYAPPPEIRALVGPRTVVTGQVPEVGPFLAQARVVLAAVRFGAGVKGKVVDALRLGVPVVTTHIGAEGIGIEPGIEAIVADDAVGLAKGVIELLHDPSRCAALSSAGADLIRRRFSRAAAHSALKTVFPTPCCVVCGSAGVIEPPSDNPREGFVCRSCFALGRAEALARVVLARYASSDTVSLTAWARQRPDITVHELGFIGGIAETLRGQPWFTCSEYFEDISLGQEGPNGVRCEDVTRLTYASGSFDLVISQDVMEHVANPVAGFAETARVLRPGGSHIFTIPQGQTLSQSITRARLNGNVVDHLLPAEYHGDPIRSQGSLVFTEFGADLKDLLARVGLRLIEHEVPTRSGSNVPFLRVFEAVKPSSDDISTATSFG